MNPFQIFNNWYEEEIKNSPASIPSACCLSTIGLDDYPNARFVSLKEIKNEGFVVTGPFNSRKGLEIQNSNKVALTFWFSATEKQVRVQGDGAQISVIEADKYFSKRNREAQIVSYVSEQGKRLEDVETLNKKYDEAERLFKNKEILRPGNWSGYLIAPIRIEFMEFKTTRFHHRTLFYKNGNLWEKELLQP